MLRLRRQIISDVMRDGDQVPPVIPCLGILEQAQHLGHSSQLIHKSSTFYGLVGGLVGIYLSSAAALAEVEEVSEDLGSSNRSISTLPSDLSIGPSIDNYDNISDKDVAKYHLDEDIIPEAVWNLQNRNPIHLDRFRDGVESQIYTGSDAHFESPILWTRTAIALWSGSKVYTSAGLLPLPLLQFQVASCGGNHAEHKDLDYCSVRSEDLQKKSDLANLSASGDDDDTSGNVANDVISSGDATPSSDNNNQSSYSLSAPSLSATSLSTLTLISNSLSQGDLIVLGQCDGALGICAVADIGLPATPIDLPPIDVLEPPIDAPAPPIDVLEPPIVVLAPPIVALAPINLPLPVAPPPTQITFLDNPEPGLDLPPVFTPSPLKPIPEASTWVMTIIGFGAMVIFYSRRNHQRTKQVVVTTFRRLSKKFINDLLHNSHSQDECGNHDV